MVADVEAVDTAVPQEPSKGFLHELAWLGAGFVLPCGSLTFYRRAARRKVGKTILFFALFALVVSILATVGSAATLLSVGDEIR